MDDKITKKAVSSLELTAFFGALENPKEYMYFLFYARVILLERRQRVHTLTFLVAPSTTARTL